MYFEDKVFGNKLKVVREHAIVANCSQQFNA